MEERMKDMLKSIVDNFQKEEFESKLQIKMFMKSYVAAYVEELRRKMEQMRNQELIQRCKSRLF